MKKINSEKNAGYVFLLVATQNGKLTGAACPFDAKKEVLSRWRDMEKIAGTTIEKLTVMDFLSRLEKEGHDMEKVVSAFEAHAIKIKSL